MSAMSVIPSAVAVERTAPMPSAPLSSAIDALQLPLGFHNGALRVLGASAVVGEHVDHDEVGDRGRRLLADMADAGGRKRALGGLRERLVLRICRPDR